MKNLLMIALMFSMAGFAKTNVLEEHEGKYLGLGKYISSTGYSASYSSYTEISPNIWSLAYVRDDSLVKYYAFFDVTEDDFFNTNVIKFSDEDGQIYSGYGYCLENYCHVTVEMDDNDFEETVTFLENGKIKKVGSLRYLDESGNNQMMRWEEKLTRMDLPGVDTLPGLMPPLEPDEDAPADDPMEDEPASAPVGSNKKR